MEARECSTSPGPSLRLSQWLTLRLNHKNWDAPILPFVRTDLFNRVLADFAKHFGIGKHKHVLLVIDQAGWHMGELFQVPEGLHLIPLPPHSPELQPAERLWPLTKEPIANQSFPSLDALEEKLFQRCQVLLQQQALIQGLTNYHWWPKTGI